MRIIQLRLTLRSLFWPTKVLGGFDSWNSSESPSACMPVMLSKAMTIFALFLPGWSDVL